MTDIQMYVCIGVLLFSPLLTFITGQILSCLFIKRVDPVILSNWKIGDTVQLTSGSPIYHIDEIDKKGYLRLCRFCNGKFDHLKEVHPLEVKVADPAKLYRDF